MRPLIKWLGLAMSLLVWDCVVAEHSLAQSAEPSPLLQVEGVLEPGDEVISDDGSLYDTYTFEGRAGQTVSIVMESTEFDTYLWLLDPQGQPIEQNDDYDATTRNARIVVTLPEDGTYTVIANAYDANQQGHYELVVTPTSPEQQASIESSNGNQPPPLFELLQEGFRQMDAGEIQSALATMQYALELTRKYGDREGEAFATLGLGRVYDAAGQYREGSIPVWT